MNWCPPRILRGFEYLGGITLLARDTARVAFRHAVGMARHPLSDGPSWRSVLHHRPHHGRLHGDGPGPADGLRASRPSAPSFTWEAWWPSPWPANSAPVLISLMVGGRVGAGITAEIGSMQVTEQIDALRALGANPVRKLVLPRLVAFVLALPALVLLADLLGIFGGLHHLLFLAADLRPLLPDAGVQTAASSRTSSRGWARPSSSPSSSPSSAVTTGCTPRAARTASGAPRRTRWCSPPS